MGKYERLEEEFNILKKEHNDLVIALKNNGSITTNKYYSLDTLSIYAGNNCNSIRYAQVDSNRALFRVKELAKFFGLKMKHTQIDKWEYVERKKTDE